MADQEDGRKEGQLSETAPIGSAAMETTQKTGSPLPFLGFVGNFTHGIDAKGRLIIPASFRDALGSPFAVTLTPDYHAVALYPIAGWIERRDELMEMVKADAQAQDFLDMFSKYSYVDCESDAQGRLLVPQKIRSYRLGDAREVDLTGSINHIRISASARSSEQDEKFDEKYPNPLATLAEMQRALAVLKQKRGGID